MCGRFTLAITGASLAEMLRLPLPPADLAPRFNIAPSQGCHTVIAPDGAKRVWGRYRWGLPSTRGLHINARSETVAERPRFRKRFADPTARCLVPADGYFEWRREGQIRQPYYIRLPDERPFCFAGLIEERNGAATFLILTTDANESARNVHSRMPAILPRSEHARWLGGNRDEATEALIRCMSPAFRRTAVSQRVNDVVHDDPSCIAHGRTQSVLFDV